MHAHEIFHTLDQVSTLQLKATVWHGLGTPNQLLRLAELVSTRAYFYPILPRRHVFQFFPHENGLPGPVVRFPAQSPRGIKDSTT